MSERRLYVHAEVLNKIALLPGRPWEVGGWLLGYWDEDEEQVLITHATPPSRGTPLKIRISGRKHHPYFEQAWEATNGQVTFLGDWHTHPGGRPLPSKKDEDAIEQLAADGRYGTTPPLMVIAGAARWPHQRVETSFGFYTKSRDQLVALRPQPTTELPPPADRVPYWSWPDASC